MSPICCIINPINFMKVRTMFEFKSNFCLHSTSLRVVVGQLFCAGIFRLRYDILLLLFVYYDHNLLILKISLKNIEFCVFYDH